jgi:hypothetical protein
MNPEQSWGARRSANRKAAYLFPCSHCEATPGNHCTAPNGAYAMPHKPRRSLGHNKQKEESQRAEKSDTRILAEAIDRLAAAIESAGRNE